MIPNINKNNTKKNPLSNADVQAHINQSWSTISDRLDKSASNKKLLQKISLAGLIIALVLTYYASKHLDKTTQNTPEPTKQEQVIDDLPLA